MSLQSVLAHLAPLVACDTQNPPRRIAGDAELFRYCSAAVGSGFTVRAWDHGDGHVSWYALRGRPRVLFNAHLDTVPAGSGWSFDPHLLQVREHRAWGLGACDIKGAAAVLLSIAAEGPRNLALLFTTDEEGAGGCCVQRFLEAGEAQRFEQVIVTEPTSCKAVLGHRGYLSVKTRFSGSPGHSSEARALEDSAIHSMARWAAAALEVAGRRKTSEQDPGACLNLGTVSGGVKSNVIAGQAQVHWSARLRPGESNAAFLEEIQACAPRGANVSWEKPFDGEPLPAMGRDTRRARQFCEQAKLEIGAPVDFWTEASLFSAAGLAALVLGPGCIAQAHNADEWVALSQLERAHEMYARLVKADD